MMTTAQNNDCMLPLNPNTDRPSVIKGVVKNYAWGKTGTNSLVTRFIPKEQVEEDTPYAEYWIGTHSEGAACVEVGDVPVQMGDYINSDPSAILGDCCSKTWSGLPYLTKILSAGSPLSIQAHPAKDEATELNRTLPLIYKDDNHKPEIAVALTPLRLVRGIKPVEQLVQVFNKYPSLKDLVEKERLASLNNSSEDEQKQTIKLMLKSILEATEEQREGAINPILEEIKQKQSSTWQEEQLQLMASLYGAKDPGIPIAMLMQWQEVPTGEGVYIGPNELHAYLSGDILEVMALSDNVMRVGLTPKFIDKENLLKHLDTTPGKAEVLSPSATGVQGFSAFQTPAREFKVLEITGAKVGPFS